MLSPAILMGLADGQESLAGPRDLPPVRLRTLAVNHPREAVQGGAPISVRLTNDRQGQTDLGLQVAGLFCPDVLGDRSALKAGPWSDWLYYRPEPIREMR